MADLFEVLLDLLSCFVEACWPFSIPNTKGSWTVLCIVIVLVAGIICWELR